MKNYEEEIEELTKRKSVLNEQLTVIMQKRHIQKHLVACEKEGHVWTLVGVSSSMFKVNSIDLLCTRCSALSALVLDVHDADKALFDTSVYGYPNYLLTWEEGTQDEMKELLDWRETA